MLPQATDKNWIFGYGSLIWRPNFPFVQKQPALLHGWGRRFFQGSPDHRGTPHRPGRVVTLLPLAQECCYGMAYQVATETMQQVLGYLNVREQGGYQILRLPTRLLTGKTVSSMVYVASPENPYYAGSATPQVIAKHIFHCSGPSGRNRDYVYRLLDSLAEFAPPEAHLNEIALALRALEASRST